MKRSSLLAFACVATLAVAVGGCNPSASWSKITAEVGLIDNALASLAKNSVPNACAIIAKAESYFHQLEPWISADKIADERIAEAVVAKICNNPPTDTGQVFATLFDLWMTIQNLTKTN